MKTLFDKTEFSIVRIGQKDAKGLSDHVSDFRNIVLQCQDSYPGIDKWFEKKVLPGLRSSERTAFVGYLRDLPVVSAVIKHGDRSKFCHLKVLEEIQSESLGQLFFALMAFELRHVADSIHFTLPESLWIEKYSFFESFGFDKPVKAGRQYRLFDTELSCSAKFSDVWSNVLEKLPRLSTTFSIGEYSMQNSLLMSVKPEFAEKIMSGEKRVEIRRKFSPKWIGQRITLYSSKPEQCLIGEASVGGVVIGQPDYIWQEFGSQLGCTRAQLQQYAMGTDTLYAIVVSDVMPYRERIPLSQISHLLGEDLRPPQSFCSLENNDSWAKAISIAAMIHGTWGIRPQVVL